MLRSLDVFGNDYGLETSPYDSQKRRKQCLSHKLCDKEPSHEFHKCLTNRDCPELTEEMLGDVDAIPSTCPRDWRSEGMAKYQDYPLEFLVDVSTGF